jgi:hypothetical protein
MAWFACKPCSESDPTQDTVKVNPKLFANGDKENTKLDANRQGQPDEEKLRKQKEEQERKEKEAAEQRKRAEAEEKRRKEEAAAAEKAAAEKERLRQQALAEERARKEAEEKEAAAQAAKEQKLREEAQRQAEEQARREAEEKKKQEEEALQKKLEEEKEMQEASEKVGVWCRDNGYKDMHTEKKTFMGGKKFPLHTAVKQQSAEVVEMIVKCGGKKDCQDSKGQTPMQLAEKVCKGANRDRILAALR